VKLSMVTLVSSAQACATPRHRAIVAAMANRPDAQDDGQHREYPLIPQRRVDDRKPLIARLKLMLATPSKVRSLFVGDLHRPGEGAVPGAGCGNAVERAVWKVTLPSTFCIT